MAEHLHFMLIWMAGALGVVLLGTVVHLLAT